jgi:hypothetical protein
MAKGKERGQPRQRLSLSVRLSLLVLFAALLPLAAVVGINDYFARGTLVEQGRTALTTDANAKAALVDTYLLERMKDGQALASLPTTPAYLGCVDLPGMPPQVAAAVNAQAGCDNPQQIAFYQGSNCRALHVGIHRDVNYVVWALYDARGDELLTSGTANCVPSSQSPVAKEDLAGVVQQGKSLVSAVYYNPGGKYAYVNIYTPVTLQPGSNQVLGFLRATLRIDYIWNLVAQERGANGAGSYAFITDENGVRIADSNPSELFTAVQPLSATTAQLIASEQRFGSTAPVKVDNLPAVASALASTAGTTSFQGAAVPGSSTQYQFVRMRLTNVPWAYFVLSPLSTVTRVADDQVRLSLVSAGVIAVLAVLLGLSIGRGTTRPVQTSAAELEGAAAALKRLASRQESSAGEQQWVVDACQTGLESVQYLSDAMDQAAHRVIEAANWFNDYWDRLNEEQARRTVLHFQELARYIDEAARRQHASSDRLAKAISVTMQVTDQLVAGATAAAESAEQLEHVVRDLRHVVGGSTRMDDHMSEGLEEEPPMPPAPRPSLLPPPQAPVAPPQRSVRSSQLGAGAPYGPYGSASYSGPVQSGAGVGWPEQPQGMSGPGAMRGGRQPAPGSSRVFGGDFGSGPGMNGYGEPQRAPESWANLSQGQQGRQS